MYFVQMYLHVDCMLGKQNLRGLKTRAPSLCKVSIHARAKSHIIHAILGENLSLKLPLFTRLTIYTLYNYNSYDLYSLAFFLISSPNSV